MLRTLHAGARRCSNGARPAVAPTRRRCRSRSPPCSNAAARSPPRRASCEPRRGADATPEAVDRECAADPRPRRRNRRAGPPPRRVARRGRRARRRGIRRAPSRARTSTAPPARSRTSRSGCARSSRPAGSASRTATRPPRWPDSTTRATRRRRHDAARRRLDELQRSVRALGWRRGDAREPRDRACGSTDAVRRRSRRGARCLAARTPRCCRRSTSRRSGRDARRRLPATRLASCAPGSVACSTRSR